MTSKNLSLTEKAKNHSKYISRTLWTSYIALPFMAGYYILILIMMLSRAINYSVIYRQSSETLFQEKVRAVSRIMGMGQIGFVLTAIIAFMFAFQGFSYIFNQSQLDFYLSQPTTRNQRVRKNIFNAISTYTIMYVGIEIIALLVAAGFGAVNSQLLLEVLVETVRTIVFFIAIYNITVLAILLSGTIPVAVLLSFFLYVVTVVLSGEFKLLKEVFFDTYTDMEELSTIASPFFDRCFVMPEVNSLTRGDALFQNGYVGKALRITWRYDLDTFIVAAVTLLLIAVCTKARRAEWAGKSIVYRPFRWFVKIVASVCAALAAGLMVKVIYSYLWSRNIYVLMAVVMLLACLLTSIIAEVILQGNIRAFAKGKAQTITALALVALIFLIYRGDLIGYDSYLPNASSVESAAILDYDSTIQFYVDNIDIYDDYSKTHMYITDIDNFLMFAKIGMKSQNDLANDLRSGKSYRDDGWEFNIMYRLKNGREVYRRIHIDQDVDPALMDAILSSEEYIKGKFGIYDDEEFAKEADEDSKRRQTTYYSGGNSHSSNEVPYSELSDALRKDLLANYGFTKMRSTLPVGEVHFTNNSDSYGSIDMPVYSSYTNTIELLKKYGLYEEDVISADDVAYIEVTDYYPGFDDEQIINSDEDFGNLENKTKIYDSKEEIQKILDTIISSEYYGRWYDYNSLSSYKYGVSIYLVQKQSQRYGTEVYASFRKGEIPDFVLRDLNN